MQTIIPAWPYLAEWCGMFSWNPQAAEAELLFHCYTNSFGGEWILHGAGFLLQLSESHVTHETGCLKTGLINSQVEQRLIQGCGSSLGVKLWWTTAADAACMIVDLYLMDSLMCRTKYGDFLVIIKCWLKCKEINRYIIILSLLMEWNTAYCKTVDFSGSLLWITF